MKYSVDTQQRKAQLFFALIVFINLVVLFMIVTGIVIGIKGYISDTRITYGAVTCCGSICSKCFFTLHTVTMILPWVCVAILFIGLCKAIYKTLVMLSWNYRFISPLTTISLETYPKLKKILPAMHLSEQLVLLDNNSLHCAFTLGLWKPKVYLSTGICSYLTRKELLAVILHEAYHKKNQDPLKLFVIRVFYELNFFLPINRYLLDQFSSASEKAADDSAINFSREPLELASALVKLSKSNTISFLNSSAAFSRGQNVVEDRLRRLLEAQMSSSCFANVRFYLSCVLSFFIAATICLSLFSKFFNHVHTIECKTRTCNMTKCG